MSSQFVPSPLYVLAEISSQRLAEEREKAKTDPSSVFYGPGQITPSYYEPSTSSDESMDSTNDAHDANNSQCPNSVFCEDGMSTNSSYDSETSEDFLDSTSSAYSSENSHPYKCDHWEKSFTQRCVLESYTLTDKNKIFEAFVNTTDQPQSHYLHLKQNHLDSPDLQRIKDKRHLKFNDSLSPLLNLLAICYAIVSAFEPVVLVQLARFRSSIEFWNKAVGIVLTALPEAIRVYYQLSI
uniref:Uncharacterized protein n=1 Tax=Tetranychus urticae TaxID=32264 RepID=T1KIW8_TETUR